MKIRLLHFTIIATILLFSGCGNDEVLPEATPEAGRTISITASIPEDDLSTRVTLERPEGTNKTVLNWESTDKIALLFVQGTYNHWGQVKVPLTSIVGKKAYFTIPVPATIDPKKAFDVYGVYGGSFDINLSAKTMQLPQATYNRVTLENIQTEKDVILYFAYHFEASANLDVSVNFKHVGSLFCIHLKSTSSTSLPIKDGATFNGVRLIGGGDNAKWSYGNGTGQGETINLLDGTFLNQETKGTNNLRFQSAGTGLSPGQTVEMWAWNPVIPNKEWPAMQLQLIGGAGPTVIKTSTNFRAAGTPSVGKTFQIYAIWDGAELNFVSKEAFEIA